VAAAVSAFAPGYDAVTVMLGGAISGYWETGSFIATSWTRVEPDTDGWIAWTKMLPQHRSGPVRGFPALRAHNTRSTVLKGFDRPDHWMSSRAEVTRRMLPGRGVTAPDVTALATESQRNPSRAFSQTVLTRMWIRWAGKAG
jgi:hypothetical protein